MAYIKPILLLLVLMATGAKAQLPACSTASLSFAVVVDGSTSIPSNLFDDQKTFLKSLLARIDVSGNSRVSISQFASTAQIESSCDAAASTAAYDVVINGINQLTGATCIKCGLEKAEEALNGNGCGRAGENKIIFLLVDGNENLFPDQVVVTATNLRNSGHFIYILAVGDLVDVDALALLTGDANRVVRATFAALVNYDVDTLYTSLTSTYCTTQNTAGWAEWSAWTACSATCDPNGITPTRSRNRVCPSGSTCPGANTDTEVCNAGEACPGVLSAWGSWGACSATCRATGANSPTRIRQRTCDNPSLTGDCNGAALADPGNCNDIPCLLTQWGNWGSWSICSATCNQNPTTTFPTRTRSRTCNNGNSCPGSSVDNESCNQATACPGVLSAWGSWGACSATCQATGANAPTRTRQRTCDSASLTGNCNGASLGDTEVCNTNLCTVTQWGNWGSWSICSATCNQNPTTTSPTRTRSRTCNNGNSCPGSSVDNENCNQATACPGMLSLWGQWGACSGTCTIPGSSSPTQQRARTCDMASLNGDCSGAPLSESRSCNTNQCTGNVISEWSLWGPCSATCDPDNSTPTQIRTRTCSGTCTGVQTNDQRNCNVGVSCSVISCSNADISYIIVMDSSSSVQTSNPDEWSQEKTFVKNFAAQLGLGTNSRIRVGVVNYGQEAEIVATCDSDSTSTLAKFNTLIDGLSRKLGGTAITDALLAARSLYTGAGCNRVGELRVVLFLTDGFENVVFDSARRISTENTVRSEALIYVGAIGEQVKLSELARVTGNSSQIFTASNFLDLSAIDAAVLHPRIINQVCQVGGSWGNWGAYGSCSISCGTTGQRTRTRQCINPITAAIQTDCPGLGTDSVACFLGDCQGAWSQWSSYSTCSATCHFANINSPPTQVRARTCVGATGSGNCGGGSPTESRACNVQVPCPGNWGTWTLFSQCSETCQSDVNDEPIESRTRVCNVGTFGGGCVGNNNREDRSCNVGVSCPGILGSWSLFGACSATCQQGLLAPTQRRERTCTESTFGGDCNGQPLFEVRDCNVEVACPGTLSLWSAWGACSENCQSNPTSPPTRSRSRTCNGGSFGGNCNGASLSQTGTCNVNVGCSGVWGSWSSYDACSATCQSNVNAAPTERRTRTCQGGTFGVTCVGNSFETRTCNVGVSCPGILGSWSEYGACSATCQLGLLAPTQRRERTCTGSTFNGDCNGQPLFEVRDCNVEVACPGTLSLWSAWGACSENCQSNPTSPPTRSRSRTCNGASFGGNCNGASLSDTGTCNVGVGCSGVWSPWSNYGACSATCQSNVNAAPTERRTRTCQGGTFGVTCVGNSFETRTCNVGVSCPGILSSWSGYGACSASCQLGLLAPTQRRERTCTGSTFNGDCNGQPLFEVRDCNVEVACPGTLTQWVQWSTCPETCQTGATPAQQVRIRTCQGASFGGNCGGADRSETRVCSAGISCPGTLSGWTEWSGCSATCHPASASSPTESRTRTCVGATLNGNCNGASTREVRNCNFQVPCPGVLTTWGPWTGCSATCQANPNNSPTRSRIRFCQNPSFGGDCNGELMRETENCNVGVICPVPGTWTMWSEWSACSKTCDTGIRSRSRTCTDPFPANAGDDCVGPAASTSTCKIVDCPVACPIQKRCNCSLAPQFPTTAPALGFFNIDDETIHAAINTLTYWTPDIQQQICESCNVQRLQISVNTVNSHVNQVKAMLDRLNEIKKRLRDIINCNNNVFIGSELWALYDYLYARCTMLNGVYTELSACQMRFEAANESCKKFGWFHQLVKHVYRKW